MKSPNRHIEALRSSGYAVVEDILTASEVDEARRALAEVFRREQRLGPRRGWHNDRYQVAYVLPQKHPLFRSFCERESLLALMRALLGSRCIVSALNGLTMAPGGREQRLHVDQEESTPGTVLTINAVHVLDDFTRENGCTRLVPGSQNRTWTGDPLTVECAEAEAVYVEATSGSLIAYDGALWHAGSRNRTERQRFAIHAFFAREWIRPHWDFPRSFSPEVIASLTDAQRRLFGFSAQPRRYDATSDRTIVGDDAARGAGPARWRSVLGRLVAGSRLRR
jgi:ectoine hydroxylase-related dioxygenase (phytanoyl-CoA dioxygenase family)